jgi:hypothetical protein
MLLDEFHVRSSIQVAGISFVSINVNFEPALRFEPHYEIFKSCRASWRDDPEIHFVAGFDTEVFEVGRTHMHVSLSSDDAGLQFDNPFRADEDATGRITMIAADTYRSVNAERDGVCEGEFYLGGSDGAEHAHFGQHASARSNHHHRLLGGEVALLVEHLVRFELRTFAEQDFDVFLRQMHVPGRDIHDKRIGLHTMRPQLVREHLPYDAFNVRAIECGCHITAELSVKKGVLRTLSNVEHDSIVLETLLFAAR